MHAHRWTVVDRIGHYEYIYCNCGQYKKVYVD
jgi:hypothetical protein